jgi:hypothetical protein
VNKAEADEHHAQRHSPKTGMFKRALGPLPPSARAFGRPRATHATALRIP